MSQGLHQTRATGSVLPTIPKFKGRWSENMEEWLTNTRETWNVNTNGCTFEEWLARNTIDLCRSWGCKDKSFAIRDIINNFIPQTLWYEIAKATMNAWIHIEEEK